MALEGGYPYLRVIDRSLVVDHEDIIEAAAGFGFDLADLSVETLVKDISVDMARPGCPRFLNANGGE